MRVWPVPVAISTAPSAFGNADARLDFVESIAAAIGLPVGSKAAVGDATFWTDLAPLLATGTRGVDCIAIDGGEGGTGAGPLVFADPVGREALRFAARHHEAPFDHRRASRIAENVDRRPEPHPGISAKRGLMNSSQRLARSLLLPSSSTADATLSPISWLSLKAAPWPQRALDTHRQTLGERVVHPDQHLTG